MTAKPDGASRQPAVLAEEGVMVTVFDTAGTGWDRRCLAVRDVLNRRVEPSVRPAMTSSRFLLCLLSVSSPCAQEPDAAALRSKLTSGERAVVAWAAHDAGRLGYEELWPELRAALARCAGADAEATDADEQRATEVAILDALIRTGASLAPQELAPWLSSRPTEAIVLASRSPAAHAELLLGVVEQRRASVHWVAACNLLLAASPGTVVPKLLESVEVGLTIDVASPMSWFYSSSHSTGRGCGTLRRLAGFPPVVWYELRLARTANCIADGPDPVSFVRTERSEASFGVGGSMPVVDCVDYALRSFYRLAERSDERPALRSSVRENVSWSGAEHLRAAVTQIEQRLSSEWSSLLDDLAARALVSPQARGIPLRIVRQVNDRREEADRTEPLPKLAPPR